MLPYRDDLQDTERNGHARGAVAGPAARADTRARAARSQPDAATTGALLDPVAPGVEAEDVVVRDDHAGSAGIRIYRPVPRRGLLPTLIYARGDHAGSDGTDAGDQLARELAAGSGAAVALPDHLGWAQPQALERCYAALAWTVRDAAPRGLDGGRIAIGGDAAGAGLAIALALHAARRGGPALAAQLLLCPVIDPALDVSARHLHRLPPTLVITAEADALCDHGEAYAAVLRDAGVAVIAARYQDVGGGFLRDDPLCRTPTADAAIAQAKTFLAEALGTGPPAQPSS